MQKTNTASSAAPQRRGFAKAGTGLVILSFVAFISLGMPDGLLGVAWPSMRAGFGIGLDAMGLLLISATIGYMISSFLSGWISARWGVGRLLAVSSAVTATALVGYTLIPTWGLIAPFAFLSGLGAGAIDAGLNHYVESHYSHKIMQWLHASFGIGISMGPIIMTLGLWWFEAWRPGYLVVAAFQATLAILFALSAKAWGREETPEGEEAPAASEPFARTLTHPAAWGSAMLFFIYTGIELSLGHWGYSLLTEARSVAPQLAGITAGSYWITFTIGRILAGLYAHRLSPTRIVQGSLILAMAGAALLWANLGIIASLAGVALVGFAIAPVFPAMVSSTSSRVGQAHTRSTIGMQMAFAGLGVSVLPTLAGFLAARFGLEVVPPLILVLAAVLLILITVLSSRGAKDAHKSEA